MFRANVVVIGGGVIGGAIAYHLTKAGVADVLLVERNEIGSGASRLAAGMVQQVTAKHDFFPMTQRTMADMGELVSLLGESVGFQEIGSIRVAADPDAVMEIDKLKSQAMANGVPVEILSSKEAQNMLPWLSGDDVQRALYFSTDGVIDPYLLTTFYVRAAREAGATVWARTAVSEIKLKGGKVVGIESERGPASAKWVIDAGGAWSSVIAKQIGASIPVTPVRSHYWITENRPEFVPDHPIGVLPDVGASTRPDGNSLIISLQERRSRSFDARELPADMERFSLADEGEDWDVMIREGEKLRRFMSWISETNLIRYVPGLSTYSPDGRPVLGSIRDLKGFLVASGCCGAGISLAGGIGDAITSMVIGADPPIDMALYRTNRFGQVDPFTQSFREKCASARSAKAVAAKAMAMS